MAHPRRPDRPTGASPDSPGQIYTERREQFGRQRDTLNRRSYRNANLSLALIAIALTCLGLWLWRGERVLLGAAALFGMGFIASFVHHGWVDRRHRRYAELWAINDEGLRRLRRDWDSLPLRQPPGDARPRTKDEGQQAVECSIAADLDLLGRASLEHLLGTAVTPVGQATLRAWLLSPAAAEVARERQAAVAELAPLLDLRDELALRGRLMDGSQPNYERFLAWAEGAPWLERRRWLLWLARGLPLATLGLLAPQVGGLTIYPLWLIGVGVGLAITMITRRSVDRIIDDVAERQSVFHTYADIFGLIAEQPFATPMLRHLQAELAAGDIRADQQMRRLGRIMALADLRGWMFFFPIQLLTLWNVHVLWLLERWQRVAGAAARRWLAALGELEALAALATLAHDNPSWVFPDLYDLRKGTKPEDSKLEARNLGHPLLPPQVCVGNDVDLGPPGAFLLVTGSNMSGKSTLLRAIGVNVVLAQAGGPVCATVMRLPPIALATSMRVQDSLERGVSYFMAELRRLKEVVATVEHARADGERVPLVLLDEILHGTNTSERQIAARQIIRHLLSLGAIGAVSTHDLTLADTPELAALSRQVHFTELFARGPNGLTMSFDYKLRPGLATSTNAIKLMELVGLPIADKMTR